MSDTPQVKPQVRQDTPVAAAPAKPTDTKPSPTVVNELPAKESPAPTPQLNWQVADNHINRLRESLEEFMGKPGMNPFIWWNKNVVPLQTAMSNPRNRTPELYQMILALAIPVEGPTAHVPLPSIKIIPQVAQEAQPRHELINPLKLQQEQQAKMNYLNIGGIGRK